MRTIVLHGHLADFGRRHRLEVATAAEAIRFLSQLAGFADRLRSGAYHVVCGRVRGGHDLDIEGVTDLKLGNGDLHIMPAIAGSKRSGLLKTILGVALVGAALFFSGGALATPLLGGTAFTYGSVAAIGAAMAFRGISELLAPKPPKDGESDESFTNAGPSNTYEQGSAIPLWYGSCITGAALISGSASVERIS